MTLTPVAERLAVELSLPVLTGLSRPYIEPRSPSCEANALPTEPPRRCYTVQQVKISVGKDRDLLRLQEITVPPPPSPHFLSFEFAENHSLSKSLKSFSFSLSFAQVTENRCHLPLFLSFEFAENHSKPNVYLVSI